MTTHVTVALDNVTLRGDDVDPGMLLAVGEIQNDFLEQNKEPLAKIMSDLACYGNASYRIEDGVVIPL